MAYDDTLYGSDDPRMVPAGLGQMPTTGLLGQFGGAQQPAQQQSAQYPDASAQAVNPYDGSRQPSLMGMIKNNAGTLALLAGLSVLARNNGRNNVGQVIGKAGIDALNGLGAMGNTQLRMDQLNQQRQDLNQRYEADRQLKLMGLQQGAQQNALTNQLGLARLGLAQQQFGLAAQKQAQEQAGMQQLQRYLGMPGGAGAGNISSGPTPQASAGLPQDIGAYVDQTATRYGIDPQLMRAVIKTESDWNPKSTSQKGAMGLGQVMPSVVSDYERATGKKVTNPYDPYQNIEISAWELSNHKKKYGNDDLALMAYNWGPGNVDSYLKTGRGMNGQTVPGETQAYVPRVQGFMQGRNTQGMGGQPRIPLAAAALPGNAGVVGGRLLEAQTKQDDMNFKREQAANAPNMKFQEAMASQAANALTSLREEEAKARQSMSDYQALDSLYERGLKTGFGQSILDDGSRILTRMGIDPTAFGLNRAATSEEFKNLTTKAVMSALLEQKGVQTEGDAQRAAQTWANIGNTPEGNKWINDYKKNVTQRTIDRSRFLRQAIKKTGDYDTALQMWDERVAQMPSVVPEISVAPQVQRNTGQSTQQAQAGGNGALPPGFHPINF